MTIRHHARRVLICTLLVAVELAAPLTSVAAGDEARYRDLVTREGVARVVESILAAYASPQATAEITQLGSVLAESSANAAAVLEALSGVPSVEAATIRAELLYAIAARVGGRQLLDDPLWQPVIAKGATLLDHEDPFVRDITAWALTSVRDAALGQSPADDTPPWKTTCLALQPEKSLECDYVWQATVQGVHRTSRDLAISAEDVVRRASGLSAYAQLRGDNARQPRGDNARQPRGDNARQPRG
ncbi:MAG: hypothetical protein ACYC4N_21650, partial [Pirellulaceae bacterium]